MTGTTDMRSTEVWMFIASGLLLLANGSAAIEIPDWVFDAWLLRFGVYAVARHNVKTTQIATGLTTPPGMKTAEFKLFIISGIVIVANGTPYLDIGWVSVVAWMGADGLGNTLFTVQKLAGLKANGGPPKVPPTTGKETAHAEI